MFFNTRYPRRTPFDKNFFNTHQHLNMQLILFASAYTHRKIKTQIFREIKYSRDELNIGIKLDNPDELNALRQYTYVEMQESRIKFVANRKDEHERKGPSPAAVLEKHIPKADRIIITTTNILTDSTIKFVLDHDTSISILSQGLTLHAKGDAGFEVFQQATSDRTLNERHRGGRPPLGCEVEGKQLVKGDNYQRVRATLQDVIEGEISKSKAAERLSCARQTITNAVQRRSLYSLN